MICYILLQIDFVCYANRLLGSATNSPKSPPAKSGLGFFIPPQSEPKKIQSLGYQPNQNNTHLRYVLQNSSDGSSPESTNNSRALKVPQTEPQKFKRRPRARSRLDLEDSPSKNKSFSANDVQEIQKREEMLKNVKKQCDSELQQFLEILAAQKPQQTQSYSEKAEEYVDTLNKIKFFAKKMTDLTIGEIVEGKCKDIVNEVQQLQQQCFLKKLAWRETVTKLLLIISRVSRLVEHLDLSASSVPDSQRGGSAGKLDSPITTPHQDG
jgi:hypothetical protein